MTLKISVNIFRIVVFLSESLEIRSSRQIHRNPSKGPWWQVQEERMHGVRDLLATVASEWMQDSEMSIMESPDPTITIRSTRAEDATALLTKVHQTRRRVQSRSVLSIKQETTSSSRSAPSVDFSC